MGIPGLTTFIEENFLGWERHKLRGKVVFDGFSLCFSLQDYHNPDWTCGGQYGEFREVVVQFIKRLRSSGISPIVVFDGIDYKGEKKAVILRRRRDSVHTIHRCLRGKVRGVPTRNVLPTLLLEVFREALKECHVQLYVVDGDADQETASLANHYRCPVVSSDSDYYLFRVTAGYIPFSRLEWKFGPVSADVYRLENFADQFKLAEKVHHFIPAILGNDFVHPVDHPWFRNHIRHCTRRFSPSQKLFVRDVIEFLSSFRSVEDLLDQVLKLHLGVLIQRELVSKFDALQTMYSSEAISEHYLMHHTLLRFGDGSTLPGWILQEYREGRFASSLMETAVVGTNILRIVPDDPEQETSLAASRPIRKATYAILSPHLKNTFVKEMVRHQDDLREEVVEIHSATDGERLPTVDMIQSLSSKRCLQVFCSVMGVNVDTLMKFDQDWWLVVAVSCYWARTASPSEHLVQALVLCLIESNSSHPRRQHHPPVDRNLATLHQYSKWQCIYLDAMKLNNLLLSPVPFVSPAFLFDGSLVTFYAQLQPWDFHYFVKRSVSPRLYSQLQAVIEAALPPRCPSEDRPLWLRRRQQQGKHNTSVQQKHSGAQHKYSSVEQKHSAVVALGNRFAMLSSVDESGSDDATDE